MGVVGVHVFTFNQVAETEKWRTALLDQLRSRR
jgi:methylenetetrahydrofolate reductase (NADPH)